MVCPDRITPKAFLVLQEGYYVYPTQRLKEVRIPLTSASPFCIVLVYNVNFDEESIYHKPENEKLNKWFFNHSTYIL